MKHGRIAGLRIVGRLRDADDGIDLRQFHGSLFNQPAGGLFTKIRSCGVRIDDPPLVQADGLLQPFKLLHVSPEEFQLIVDTLFMRGHAGHKPCDPDI